MSEIHLFIIWSKASYKKDEIITDISKDFIILDIINTSWSKKQFSSNLTRFYGENLPRNSHKEKHCGNDDFISIVVRDINPVYEPRGTSKGLKYVNIKMFDKKQLYRKWTGGGHKIHGTDNTNETREQLMLLYGEGYEHYMEHHRHDVLYKNHTSDLVGTNGFRSFEELFEVLNNTVNYIVLRNYENLESQLSSLHPDVDILVDDKYKAISILNAKPTTNLKYRVQYSVIVSGKEINFDIRHIGDGYYDAFWQKTMLQKRRLHLKGFYVPDGENHFYSLLYHALIHKNIVSIDYLNDFYDYLKKLNFESFNSSSLLEYELVKLLDSFMLKNKYLYTEPRDLTVLFNIKNICGVDGSNLTFKRKIRNIRINFRARIKKILIRVLNKVGLINAA